jgi:hypothetical protein
LLDYEEALKLEPNLGPALYNRATIHYRYHYKKSLFMGLRGTSNIIWQKFLTHLLIKLIKLKPVTFNLNAFLSRIPVTTSTIPTPGIITTLHLWVWLIDFGQLINSYSF